MKTRGLRSFFFRLFYPMIALSIIPSLLITLLINLLYSRYQLEYFKNECTMTASQIADSIDGLLGDYETIVSFVAENEAVELALQGDRGYDDDVREIISNCMFRMKGRMELHVLSFLEDERRFSSGTIPHLYRYSVHGNWNRSIFYSIQISPYEVVLRPTRYTNAASDSICLALGQAVVRDGETVGCVILDIYRNELYNIIEAYSSTDTQRIGIFYQQDYVILDTKKAYSEGLSGTGLSIPEIQDIFAVEQSMNLTSVYYWLPLRGFTILNQFSTVMLFTIQSQIEFLAICLLAVNSLLCFFVSMRVARRQTQPLETLKEAMERVAQGNWDTRIHLNCPNEMLALEKGFNYMVSCLQKNTDELVAKENLVQEAQLRSLQAQINPHFLLNTLASVRALARRHNIQDISTIVDHLSTLLSYNVYGASEMISLQEDILLIEKYIAIQNIRFGNKFDFSTCISPGLENACLPPLVLQTVVENAIIHGLEGKVGPGKIRLTARPQEDDFLLITIWDNGVGMPSEAVQSINSGVFPPEKRKHIGLRNAQERIRLHFGPQCGLWVESELGAYTTVSLRIRIILQNL